MINIGNPVPNFTVPATSETTVELGQLVGKNIILYFYPKDHTPGCTSQGLDFKSMHDDFLDANALVFGVSQDSLEEHEKFKLKQGYPFELISDQDGSLCKLFDVIRMKSMYGKKFMGIERSTFLIDHKGVLQHEWRKVRIKNHVKDVLQATRALNAVAQKLSSDNTSQNKEIIDVN